MSKPTSFTRRQFMQSSTAGLTLASASALGANDTIRLALIGCSRQGVFDLQECLKAPKTKAVALCDVDQTQLNKAAQSIGGGVETTGDFRRILDRKDVDAVIIAT
ncbi:MAG TPA: Gfo/Idh/MocA family oxidoreductase, partial [Blastocatellia bacterium]|nr:Gfo/Idh/MocA family oxidoreductase [Blastocatellia bacterium]